MTSASEPEKLLLLITTNPRQFQRKTNKKENQISEGQEMK
jgi:hypothetical protein